MTSPAYFSEMLTELAERTRKATLPAITKACEAYCLARANGNNARAPYFRKLPYGSLDLADLRAELAAYVREFEELLGDQYGFESDAREEGRGVVIGCRIVREPILPPTSIRVREESEKEPPPKSPPPPLPAEAEGGMVDGHSGTSVAQTAEAPATSTERSWP